MLRGGYSWKVSVVFFIKVILKERMLREFGDFCMLLGGVGGEEGKY